MTDLRQDLAQAGTHATGDPDLDHIRRRGRQLRTRRRLARVGVLSSLVLLATLLAIQGDSATERSTLVADDPVEPIPSTIEDVGAFEGDDPPTPTTTSVTVPEEGTRSSSTDGAASAPTTSLPPPSTSGLEPAGPTTHRQRILTDPAGDTESGPTIEPDPSLDLLALDVAYDGERLTFIHVVEGQPTSDPPPGGTGRWHDTYFRIRGHNLVHVRAETMERDLVVVIGVIVPGARVGEHPAQRCRACTVTFDRQAREVLIEIPVAFLNEILSRSGGGAIQQGVEVGGWEAHTAKTHTTRTYHEERESPHYFTETRMDSARRYDIFWTVP